jgi:O-antigen ligase
MAGTEGPVRLTARAHWRAAAPVRASAAVPITAPVTPAADGATGGLAFFIFCVYTFALIGRPQDYVPALVPFRIVLVLTIVASIATALRGANQLSRLWQLKETRLYVGLFVVMCIGIPFSVYRRRSFDAVFLGYIGNLVFYLLFAIHVNTAARYRRVVYLLMVAGLLFGLVGITQGEFTNGRFDTGSEMFDPNDVAFVEMALIAFPLCVLLGSFNLFSRALALGSLLLSALLTLYTGSRGGLVAMGVLLALFLVIRIPRVKKWHKVLLLVALLGAAYTNRDKINVERYRTLTDLGDDYNLQDESGRGAIWQRGFQLFLQRPLTGVGVSGFAQSIGTMRAEENVLPKWQAPHNSYLQVLTETGLFGALAFIGLIAITANTLFRSSDRAGGLADCGMDIVPPLLFIGFTATLVNASFLSQGYSVVFTLFFAMAVSLRGLARPLPSVDPVSASRASTQVPRVR